tara:strand:+ start:3675 stop:3932 length:258 start_codon:yes stop_codon:yes gene_type:complete
MSEKLETFKKKLLYRASYRGTKEMDILLKAFVKQYINNFNYNELQELESFLKFEDEIILNYYNFGSIDKDIDKNPISQIFKKFKI